MTDWRTIRIPEEDFKRHKGRKEKMGVTWSEYIDEHQPELPFDLADIRQAAREGAGEAIEGARR